MYKTPLEVMASRNYPLGDSSQMVSEHFEIVDPVMKAGLQNQPEVVRAAIKDSKRSFTDLLMGFAAGARVRLDTERSRHSTYRSTRKSIRELPEEL